MAVKRVAVIGAGAAGLCAVRHLKRKPQIFHVVCFELNSVVGGTWNYTDSTGVDQNGFPIQSSMYKNLRTNLPKEVMAFPNFPFSSSLSSFIKHEDVLDYLESYARHYSLFDHIQFNTIVTKVSPKSKKEEKSSWDVSYCDSARKDKEQTQSFDAVIVCNGHYAVPLYPNLPGLEGFRGKVKHSHDYRYPEEFKDLRVVCLGAAASGQDIAIDVASLAKMVYLSHNKMPLETSLPDNVQQKQGIKKVNKSSVIFNNDEEVEIDALLLCTGYHYSFPFLSEECRVQIIDERISPLYKHLIHIDFPTLTFIGIPKTICPFPMFDVQVQFFLAYLNGNFILPSKNEMLTETEHDFQQRLAMGLPARYAHTMGHKQWAYNDELADMANFRRIPKVVQNLYDGVHEMRVKDIANYKRINYELIDSETYREIK